MKESAPLVESSKKSKVLIVRTDRIGDVVLSTPVFEAIKHYQPQTVLDVLVKDDVFPVVEHNPFLSEVLTYKPLSTHKGLRGFFRLVRELRQKKYDICVVLQVSFFISAAIFFSRIRYRVGPFSKWYSFLFFNRGIRQNRSAVEMHEADYNLMLLRKLGIRAMARQFTPHVTVDADAKERMRVFLKNIAIKENEPFVIVHPGMRGSALNWPEGYFVDLIKRLAMRDVRVVVTGSIYEKNLVERVVSQVKGTNTALVIDSFYGANSLTGLSDFIGLLSLASVVVAPSTGPLHLATALGKKTVSFFSPIKVQSALRWGPYVSKEENHSILVPDALCGQDFKCAGKKCYFYFCMERLGVEEAVRNVMAQLEK